MTLHRQQVGKLALWAILILFALIHLRYGVLPALGTTRGDFANYYTASRLLLDDVSLERAYRDFPWFQRQMDRYGIRNQVGGFIPHPPATALLFLPLAPMDAVTARNLWSLINVLLTVLSIVLLSKVTKLQRLPTAVLFLGTGYGLLNNLLFGQVYLLVILTILAALYLRERGWSIAAGIALGLMIPVKYVGVVFLAYFFLRREWRLGVAGLLSAAAIMTVSVLLGDWQSYQTFLAEVLPRHLAGEIQDPFAVFFQSWNTLLRRLFVFDPTLNPNPVLNSFAAFVTLKNIIFATLAIISGWVFLSFRSENSNRSELFHLGFIPLVILLLSPGSATYHFLLLTISIACFTRLLLDDGRVTTAMALGGFFVVLNLPHYMKLLPLAEGWGNVLVYSRLWLLFAFFVTVIILFRNELILTAEKGKWLFTAAILLLTLNSAVRDLNAHEAVDADNARPLVIQSREFDRHFGLVLKSPDVGRETLVFSYLELLDEDYAIYSSDGAVWLEGGRNYYHPQLAADDSTLLVETVENGRNEIWLYRRGGRPRFLVAGRNPAWLADVASFVYIDASGGISVTDTFGTIPTRLVAAAEACAISPDGSKLAYVTHDERFTLHQLDLPTGLDSVLMSVPERITSPAWSPDENRILFCWTKSGNRDIWSIEVATGTLIRITTHRAADDGPVWDAANRRIVFTSDRGRGLEFSTLYEIPIPRGWR